MDEKGVRDPFGMATDLDLQLAALRGGWRYYERVSATPEGGKALAEWIAAVRAMLALHPLARDGTEPEPVHATYVSVSGPPPCPNCGRPLERFDDANWVCRVALCHQYNQPVSAGLFQVFPHRVLDLPELPKCPTCGQELTQGHLEHRVAELRAQTPPADQVHVEAHVEAHRSIDLDAVQPLVDLILIHVMTQSVVHMERSWGSWGLDLTERLDYALARAGAGGVNLRGHRPELRGPHIEDADWMCGPKGRP